MATGAAQRAVERATQVVGADSFQRGHIIERLAQDVGALDLCAGRTFDSEAVRVGEWLAQHYPARTRIYYDIYTYVPPRFSQALSTFAMTAPNLRAFAPDIVVTNDNIRGRYLAAERGVTFVGGPAEYASIRSCYLSLADGSLGYCLVQSFGSSGSQIRVYASCATNR